MQNPLFLPLHVFDCEIGVSRVSEKFCLVSPGAVWISIFCLGHLFQSVQFFIMFFEQVCNSRTAKKVIDFWLTSFANPQFCRFIVFILLSLWVGLCLQYGWMDKSSIVENFNQFVNKKLLLCWIILYLP